MDFQYKHYKDNILFIPLGGTDEIGLNLYLYHYKGKWLVVDLGIGFAGQSYPGIDILVPDISYLAQIKSNIVGLIITHAHEDHLGAVQYLWSELKLPVFTTKFTAAVLKAKLSDFGLANDVKINEIPENGKFNVDVFDLEFVGLTHSIPQMQALAIRTDRGIVFHTGDWKFDDDPIVGNVTDYNRLKALGDEGVLAMICDSTNIFNPGTSGSEGVLRKSLQDLIASPSFKQNMVVVTTFASNIARVHSIAKAAEAAGRKIMFAGKSLWRMYYAAKDSGYLLDINEPITTKDFPKYRRDQLLLIATGCQGEPLAAVTRIARQDHPDIKLAKDDVVIFSSKIIPGNEAAIFNVFNKLCKLKVEVLTEKDHFVHVSGHPNLDEMKRMYELIRPKIAIPVHGEPMHIHEHCNFAKNHGAQFTFQVENGMAIKIDDKEPECVGKVSTGHLAIDGNFILPSDSDILKMRRIMRDHGLVVVIITINKKRALLKAPLVLAPGVLDPKEDSEYFDQLVADLRDSVQSMDCRSEDELEKRIKSKVKKFFQIETGKFPKILVQVQKIPV